MPPLVQAEDLLDLRLGLEHEVLGAASANHEDTARAAVTLGVQHDGGRLVDIRRHVIT